MDKQHIYTCSGILFSLKKVGNSDKCYNMDESWVHYTKPITKTNIVWLHLYEVHGIVNFKEGAEKRVEQGVVV